MATEADVRRTARLHAKLLEQGCSTSQAWTVCWWLGNEYATVARASTAAGLHLLLAGISPPDCRIAEDRMPRCTPEQAAEIFAHLAGKAPISDAVEMCRCGTIYDTESEGTYKDWRAIGHLCEDCTYEDEFSPGEEMKQLLDALVGADRRKSLAGEAGDHIRDLAGQWEYGFEDSVEQAIADMSGLEGLPPYAQAVVDLWKRDYEGRAR